MTTRIPQALVEDPAFLDDLRAFRSLTPTESVNIRRIVSGPDAAEEALNTLRELGTDERKLLSASRVGAFVRQLILEPGDVDAVLQDLQEIAAQANLAPFNTDALAAFLEASPEEQQRNLVNASRRGFGNEFSRIGFRWDLRPIRRRESTDYSAITPIAQMSLAYVDEDGEDERLVFEATPQDLELIRDLAQEALDELEGLERAFPTAFNVGGWEVAGG